MLNVYTFEREYIKKIWILSYGTFCIGRRIVLTCIIKLTNSNFSGCFLCPNTIACIYRKCFTSSLYYCRTLHIQDIWWWLPCVHRKLWMCSQ